MAAALVVRPQRRATLVRAQRPTSPGTLEGVSIVYNSPATIACPDGAFDEVVAPGALRPALSRPDAGTLALLRDHDPSLLLARLGSRTLKVLDDSTTGLRVMAPMPPTELGAETAELVARGDLSGMSFGFIVGATTWHEPAQRGGRPVRVIRQISRLLDISVVTYPAYAASSVKLLGAPEPRSARRSPDHAARVARYEARRAALGSVVRPLAYGPPVRRQPVALEEWCRRRPVRVGTEARASR